MAKCYYCGRTLTTGHFCRESFDNFVKGFEEHLENHRSSSHPIVWYTPSNTPIEWIQEFIDLIQKLGLKVQKAGRYDLEHYTIWIAPYNLE